MKNKMKPIESAQLLIDGAVETLKEGKDAKSYLFQACMQLAKHCEVEGEIFLKQAKQFKQRAQVIKKLSEK